MCGIAGFLHTPGATTKIDQVLGEMMQAIAHRGPDSRGQWRDPEAGVALGHLRLAIVDLSAAGHQPMAAPSGRYQLTFNGEIYIIVYHRLSQISTRSGQNPKGRLAFTSVFTKLARYRSI